MHKINRVNPHNKFISELQYNDIIEEESGILVVQKSYNGSFLECKHIATGIPERLQKSSTYRPLYIGYLVEIR